MRPVSPTLAAYIADPSSFRNEFLIVINARDRTTGAIQTIGFWTGATHEPFTIDGVTRVFYGAGTILEPPEILYETGTGVTALDVKSSPFSSVFTDAVRLYDVRQCRCEMYKVYFSTATEALIEAPHRIFKGRSDQVTITDAAEGSASEAVLSVVGTTRSLTRSLAAKWSDTVFKKRSGDRLLKYSDTAEAVQIVWGNT